MLDEGYDALCNPRLSEGRVDEEGPGDRPKACGRRPTDYTPGWSSQLLLLDCLISYGFLSIEVEA